MKTIDFYCGFEGEPELIINSVNKGETIQRIRLWSGYFNQIIESITPEQDGNWKGVTLNYHTETELYDSPWICDDINLFIEQLDRIDNKNFDSITKKVYFELKQMALHTVNKEYKLIFEYD